METVVITAVTMAVITITADIITVVITTTAAVMLRRTMADIIRTHLRRIIILHRQTTLYLSVIFRILKKYSTTATYLSKT